VNEQEINAAVAEKVAGWFWATHPYASGTCWLQEPGTVLPKEWKRVSTPPRGKQGSLPTDYLHDEKAVIALLERSPYDVHATFVQTCCTWYVTLMERFIGKKEWTAEADTFCRAACLALLRAHGVENKET
jgi:hypothetical protein